jgi:hypothetical protein
LSWDIILRRQEGYYDLHCAGGIVFFHGLLHFYLRTQLIVLPTLKTKSCEIGWYLYPLSSLLSSPSLFFVLLLEQWKPYGWPKVLLASSAVDCFTYHHLALVMHCLETPDWLLSTLFATSHPIASVTGCFQVALCLPTCRMDIFSCHPLTALLS